VPATRRAGLQGGRAAAHAGAHGVVRVVVDRAAAGHGVCGERRAGHAGVGAASSIGSAAVQVARIMGFRVCATATASERYHAYLKGLGASRVFDYKSEGVVEKIVEVVKGDGVTVNVGFDAVVCLKECLEFLKETKGEGATAKLAEATPLSEDSLKMEGVDARFVSAAKDKKEQTEFFHFVFNVWPKEKLEKGEFVPSPGIKVIDGGLE
jgi:D-arabinose 1-dehydrogenase-like Zn-dependent alcohol dehydrogenase